MNKVYIYHLKMYAYYKCYQRITSILHYSSLSNTSKENTGAFITNSMAKLVLLLKGT